MIPIDEKEIYRYLGYGAAVPSEEVQQRIRECVSRLQKEVQPAFVCRRLPIVRPEDSTDTLKIGELTIQSHALSRNLEGCRETFLFGATLGIGPDRLIRRAQVNAIADAAICQAVCAQMIETYCDERNEELRRKVHGEGFSLRPRFSPGYGDCPLSAQRDISAALSLPKSIGVFLTDSLLMVPSKSVTAFAGIAPAADISPGNSQDSCEACGKADCLYSRIPTRGSRYRKPGK